jgi:hypothetical protein
MLLPIAGKKGKEVAAVRPAGHGRGGVGVLRVSTKRLTLQSLLTVLTLLGAVTLVSARVGAEEIDFGQINKFESIATGTLHVGKPPKIIVDDGERHVVILTIWDADAETKVYWKSPDGNARTTIIPGKARLFKRPENSSLRLSVNQIAVSSMDTCCLARENNDGRTYFIPGTTLLTPSYLALNSCRTIFAPSTIARTLPKAMSRGRYFSPQSGATTMRSADT